MYGTFHTDQQLLEALSRGDREATERVYRKQGGVLLKWLYQQGCPDTDASEILQEAMVVLFERSQDPAFRLQCALGTYLFAVGRRLWLKKLQSTQRSPAQLPLYSGEEGVPDWIYDDDIRQLKEKERLFEILSNAMKEIGEPCRSLLLAFYQDNKSMQEIAGDFKYTNPDNAKTQKYKCLNRLRKIFYKQQETSKDAGPEL